MSMLALAIKARVPIIRATTTDLLNLEEVLQSITPPGMLVRPLGTPSALDTVPNCIHYSVAEFTPTDAHYLKLRDKGSVLLLINQELSAFAFDAGELPVPRELMIDLLEEAQIEKKQIGIYLPLFNGLTLKQMGEVVQLTQARDSKKLTRKGVMRTRATLVGKMQGMGGVDTEQTLYLPPAALTEWLEVNKPYFLEGKDERLVPRGVLFRGGPGVGKGAAAKYIANDLEVPLYRLALAASLSKWHGESEANLERILGVLDQEEPCVLLVDEVEKLFADTEDQGITSRLLSQLLWWLAEHRSRVLTVMTTNNLDALPNELYRAGRVDAVIEIKPCTFAEARVLGEARLRQFIKPTDVHLREMRKALSNPSTAMRPHAEVINIVDGLIKQRRWV